MLLGLVAAVVLAHGSVLKAIAMIVMGLLIGLVGTDGNTGGQRFTFGIRELTDGIDVATLAIGLFGIGEIISNLARPAEQRSMVTQKITRLWPTGDDFRRSWRAVLRGTALGSILGVLPGGGATLSSFAAYALEKKVVERARAVRPRRGGGRGGAGIGQQCRRADLVHPDADARHSRQRGDGADDRRADHSRHPAGAADHDRAADSCSGA